jgi:hypothetical protein
MSNNLPQKPDLGDWLEDVLGLPFRLPRIPFAQTAKNLDRAVATLVAEGGENLASRVRAATARIEARSEAEITLIEYGAKQIADPAMARRARDYAIGDILRAQANREEVLRNASEELANHSPDVDANAELDEDWLNAFSKYAEQKSKADIQRVWGKILAAEIRAPGATSLRTLQFLSTVSSSDAQKITGVFQYVVGESFIPRYVLDQNLVSFADLMHLQELNILSGLYGLGGPTMNQNVTSVPEIGQVAALKYFEKQAVFKAPLGVEFKLQVPALPLSEIGRQLFAISDNVSPDYGFFEKLCLHVKPSNTNSIVVIGPTPLHVHAIFGDLTI